MTLQIHRQMPMIVMRKSYWRAIISLTALLIFIPVYMQTRKLQTLMTHGDSAETSTEELLHGMPHAWDVPTQTNDTSELLLNSSFPQHPQEVSLPSNNTTTVTRKWAYAFLLGGCNVDEPEYRGFLYNIMMVTRRLRRMAGTNNNSTGNSGEIDMVLLIQMSWKSKEQRLPALEEKMLDDLNIIYRYIPTFASATHEVFYALMMEKFRILELAGQYSRILFLDSDQWPFCGLDYLFELSEPSDEQPPRLKENVLMAWRWEPCNGGFFMFAPKQGDYEQIMSIIRRREEDALTMAYPHWNVTSGWGHVFEENDRWKSPKDPRLRSSPTNPISNTVDMEWGWHGAFADQGLIYFWAKYVKQSVSLIIDKQIENWGSCNGSACLESSERSSFMEEYKCQGRSNSIPLPYGSIHHMTGKKKPWVQPKSSSYNVSSHPLMVKPWFDELHQMSFDLLGSDELSVEVTKLLERRKQPSVGAYPAYKSMYEHIKDKQKRNWNPYMETAGE